MGLVQRVSLIAFAIHDGMARNESELNDDQRTQQIRYDATADNKNCILCFLLACGL